MDDPKQVGAGMNETCGCRLVVVESAGEYTVVFEHCHRHSEAHVKELEEAITEYMESPVHGDHKGVYNPEDCCAASARVRAALRGGKA